MSLWEPFTEGARKAIVAASEESGARGANYIGTEHLLLGILKDSTHIGTQILNSLEFTYEVASKEVDAICGKGTATRDTDMVMTPRSKRVIELAFEEARKLAHNYIGVEHLLLGMIRENEGVAARVLRNALPDVQLVYRNIIERLAPKAVNSVFTEQKPWNLSWSTSGGEQRIFKLELRNDIAMLIKDYVLSEAKIEEAKNVLREISLKLGEM